MRFIALFCGLFLLLSSCGSDNSSGPSAQGSGSQAVIVNCPRLNGTYSRRITTNKENGEVEEQVESIQLATKVENGTFHYSFSDHGRFLQADGQLKEIESEGQEGEIQVSCNESSVTLMMKQEDQDAITLKYTTIDATQIKVESSSEAAGPTGTFKLEQ